MNKVKNKLQVRHYPQIPCEPFCVDVADEVEADKIMTVLADQHLWLFDKHIIPDYSNSIMVLMYDENSDGEGNPGWSNYWNEEEGMEWDEFKETYLNQQ